MTNFLPKPLEPILPSPDGLFGLIDRVFDGVALWEPDPWRIEYANPAFWQLIGVPAEALEEGPSVIDVRAEVHTLVVALLDRFRDHGVEGSTATTVLDGMNDRRPIEVRLCHVTRDDKRIVGMILRGSAGVPPAIRALGNSARHDPLTGLPDREFLAAHLAIRLKGERMADRQFAVVFLDLDNFKQVNDEFGHLIGDNVLREAARRIADCLREGDHVVRYGGDEFVVLVAGVTATREVEPVIGRIHLALAAPIAIPGGEVSLSLSAGMALASKANSSPEELLAAADRAMYAAKRTAV